MKTIFSSSIDSSITDNTNDDDNNKKNNNDDDDLMMQIHCVLISRDHTFFHSSFLSTIEFTIYVCHFVQIYIYIEREIRVYANEIFFRNIKYIIFILAF